MCRIEQTFKVPKGTSDKARRQNNLHPTPGRMRHPHSALFLANIYAYLQSRPKARPSKDIPLLNQ